MHIQPTSTIGFANMMLMAWNMCCVCGDDMLAVEGSDCFVDVSGLAGHKVIHLLSVTAQALVVTHKGYAIATFHQMACLVKAKVYCLAVKWKLTVPTLMTNHVNYMEVNKLISLMGTDFRWISRMVYLTSVAGNQMKRKLVPYHILS
jgi:hypothetical protein